MSKRYQKRGWTLWHLMGVALLSAAAALVTSDAWSDLAQIAMKDEESSHVLLVPIAVVWICFVRRETLRNCRPIGYWAGPTLMAGGWGLWALGYARDVQAFWHGGAVIFTVGAGIAVLGVDVLRRLWPAFAVLIFLVPVPGMLRQAIAQPMQTATAHATQAVADLCGIPVECWGNTLEVNGTNVGVAEACNGMRMIFTLFLVSYTFAFTTPLRPFVRLLIIAASPFTAIVCNVARLVPTVYVYGRYSAEIASQFHTFSGWCMLIVGFLALMGIVRLLKWLMIPVTPYPLSTV